jgi:hypothetical protein
MSVPLILLVHAVSAIFLGFFLYRFHSFFSVHLIHTILHYNSIMSMTACVLTYSFLVIPMSMPWCSLSALNCANSSFSMSYFFCCGLNIFCMMKSYFFDIFLYVAQLDDLQIDEQKRCQFMDVLADFVQIVL